MSIESPQQDALAVISLAGAVIVLPDAADAMVRFAAYDLARYLYQLTGSTSPVSAQLPSQGAAVVLDEQLAVALGKPVSEDAGDQGYRLAVVRDGTASYLLIAARAPSGVLYGVYGLLEMLGMGFYAGGDTFPEQPVAATLPAALDIASQPSFAVRGNMLHYNFLCGCTDWGLADYKFYFDQLARMRCNMLLMHWYDGEPGAAYEVHGEYLAGGVTPNSLTRPWGAIESLRTSQFYFDTARFFDEEIYTAPPGADFPDLLTEVKRSEVMFSEATRYARSLGVNVAAGFEAPNGQCAPTDPQTVARFRARVSQFLARNPHLAYFALWQHESGACYASDVPAPGTPAYALFQEQHALFAYLGNERRIWEAIRFGRFAQLAAEVVAAERPGLRMVVVGWGGDRWMQFADLCLAYDTFLPPFVAFTCHDNIDASMGANVSTPWGQLPPARERWAMPWVEGDIDECMVRQPNVETLGRLAPDALAKGCQGLLTLQWRTRDVEEETAFIAQFAWDTGLTPEKFYRTLARQAFGSAQEERMGAHLATLQRLGAHWTGVRGSVECGKMTWTGWEPHIPFAIDGNAAVYLAKLAEIASRGLAEVPSGGIGNDGAFHVLSTNDGQTIPVDEQRLGARELAAAAARLRALAAEPDVARLHAEFVAIEEEVYALRPQLVANGMTSPGYRGLDGFLIAIHHLQRNVGVHGVEGHFQLLRAIRADVETLCRDFRSGTQDIHRERLNLSTRHPGLRALP